MGGLGGDAPSPQTKKRGAKVSFGLPQDYIKNINLKGFEVIFVWETQKNFACGSFFLENHNI